MSGWIAVDLDGTLAYHGGTVVEGIGEPIGPMLNRVKAWLKEGREVRIFTARASIEDPLIALEMEGEINDWCRLHIGQTLPITCKKDFGMIELWDDRAVGVIPNTGLRADRK